MSQVIPFPANGRRDYTRQTALFTLSEDLYFPDGRSPQKGDIIECLLGPDITDGAVHVVEIKQLLFVKRVEVERARSAGKKPQLTLIPLITGARPLHLDVNEVKIIGRFVRFYRAVEEAAAHPTDDT